MDELIYLKILYTIRENGNSMPLRKLIYKMNLSRTNTHMSPYLYYIDLCNEGYIIFIDNSNNDISESICKIDSVIEINNFFKSHYNSKNKDINVELTNKLSKIQSLLGFSLTDTISKFSSIYSTMVTPIWHQPNTKLVTDVFVIMPFQEDLNLLYKNHIKLVCQQNNLTCKRADDIYSSKPIMHDIWSLIYNSKIIIADCSNKNPNVMYELGIAHTIGKKVILITQNINDIPFDLRHLRHFHYQHDAQSIIALDNDLKLAIQSYLAENLDDVF